MKDLFEGDLVIQSEEFAAQFARRAFGPLTGPVLLTRYGFKNIEGSTFTIYRTASSNYATMYFDVNRVVKNSSFYILMEIEQILPASARNSMQFLEIRYLNRPIIEILEALKIA